MARIGRDLILSPICYSEVCGQAPSLSDLRTLIAIPEWKLLASRCIGIASIAWQHGIEDAEQHEMLFREFGRRLLYGPALELKLRRGSHRRLYTREGLLAIQRLAIVKQSTGTALSDSEFSDVFHKALLVANELVVEELNPESPSNTAKDFLATELRSVLSQQQNPHDLIARSASLFEWSNSLRGRARGADRLHNDFIKFTGLTPDEYAASAYLTLARSASTRTWDQFSILGAAFDPQCWLSSQGVVDMQAPMTFLDRHTVSIHKARTAWARETSLSFAGAGPLWKRPLVADQDGLIFVPSPFFVGNLLGDGTYFELFDGYGDRNTEFSTLYGHFFQDYVEDRLRNGYAGRTDARLWADIPFANGRSSDVIISEGKHVIFVEVVAKRMQLVGSVLRLSESAIADDLLMGVIKKLQQLQDNINAFRSGALLPEIPRVEGQRLYPVLVAPREWPRLYVLMHLLGTEPHLNLLINCEPVELLDVGEVEDLEGRIRSGLRLAELLDRKNHSTAQNRAISLHNYLTVVEPGTFPVLRSPTRERGGDVAKRLMDLAATWTQCGNVP